MGGDEIVLVGVVLEEACFSLEEVAAACHVPAQWVERHVEEGLLGFGDVANGLFKSVVFGLVMGLASCHFGLATTGGAPGVGRAVNSTVVTSAAGIFVLDYLVSFALGG